MIKLTDVAILSLTKLRPRPVRTAITIILASLLFGILVAVSLVSTGIFHSINDFRKDGLTSRYIVSVSNVPNDNPLALQNTMRDPALVTEAKKRYEKLVQAKTAEAKKLNISYSQINDQPPYKQTENGSESLALNDPNGITRELLKEKFSTTPAFDDKNLSEIAKKYHAAKLFSEQQLAIAKGSSLAPLADGKEVFRETSNETSVNANNPQPPVNSSSLTITPPEISNPFLLANNGGWQPDGKSLPIILPQNTIERLLAMNKLPDSASARQKLNRLKTVRERASGLTFQMCYRNDVSQAQIQQALQQQREISANKNKKDYQKPSLIYALPDSAKCENARVASDTRTAEEKKQDANQKLFDSKFGKNTEPSSRFISFKIVGVSPTTEDNLNPEQIQNSQQARNASDIINNLLKTDGIGQAIPRSLYNKLPNKADYADVFTYTPLYLFGNEDNIKRYVEFTSAKDAQKFIDEQSCTVQYDNTCQPKGRQYQATLAFSNSAAIDDMQRLVNSWLSYGMIGVMILAAIIMWTTIGRTIVDGRHETAVFRAIGFKRIDITAIYILYTIILSTFIAICAAVIGFACAHILDNQFSLDLTAQAQYSFGGLDLAKRINLVGYDWNQLLAIITACLVTGLLSVVLPLIRNVRRSPIQDMREE